MPTPRGRTWLLCSSDRQMGDKSLRVCTRVCARLLPHCVLGVCCCAKGSPATEATDVRLTAERAHARAPP